MVPAGYSLLPLQGTTSKSVGRGDRAAKTTEKTNTEDRDEPATNNDGRQESTVKRVCIMSESVVLSVLGQLSHLSKLAASIANQTNNKTKNNQKNREDQTKHQTRTPKKTRQRGSKQQ